MGILIVKSQVPLLLGVSSFAQLGAVGPGAAVLTRLPFGLALVAFIFVVARRAPKVPSLLAGLLVGLAAFHGLRLAVPGIDLGPVVGAVSLAAWAPAPLGGLGGVLWPFDVDRWRIVLGGALTLALVGTLDTVFTLRGARNLADIAVDQDRDLVGQGLANVAAAMTGGLFVSTSMSLSATNHLAGGRTRVSTLAAALVLLAGLVLFPGVIASLPLLVLGSILVVVGINVVDKSAIRLWKQAIFERDPLSRAHAWRNGAVALAVVLATFLGQPVMGTAVGVILACLVFMIEMNRPIVRRRDTTGTLRSKRIRSVVQNALLSGKRHERVVLELQGVLFFGNADRLASEVEQQHQEARLVLLDFHHVTNVDASGAAALDQIAGRLGKGGRRLVLSGLKDDHLLRGGAPALAAVRSFVDLDAALEHVEEELLTHGDGSDPADVELMLHETDFGRAMEPGDLEILARHMERQVFPRGAILSRAGDPGDRLWVLARGTLGIWVDTAEGRRRLASIGTGCVVGEMGLLNDAPRSADVCADEDVCVHVLTSAAFTDVLAGKPRIAQAVLTSIARQLAERLRATTEELRAAMS